MKYEYKEEVHRGASRADIIARNLKEGFELIEHSEPCKKCYHEVGQYRREIKEPDGRERT